MFAGSDEGGRRAAILYTMIASCQQHGVEPFTYLRDVLGRIPSLAKPH
ncbi:transposase domain-containing protein [bacterium]|nr:transposase domain-containing protein [bacterium]